MKKLLPLIFVLLLFTSCGKSGERAVTYDCDNNFQQYSDPYICGDDDALFFAFGDSSQLWFYDKATGISGLLCLKPECDHSGTDCNAYFNGRELSLYDGKLYSLGRIDGGFEIISLNTDGTNRKTVLSLSDDIFGGMISGGVADMRGMFHRGYFYACGTAHKVVDGIPINHAQAVAYPLGGGKGRMIYDNSELTSIKIQPYGDFLYFVAYSSDAFKILRYSPNTDEVEILYSDESSILPSRFWVIDDGILIGDNGTDGKEAKVYKFDFESGKISLLFDFNADTDKTYLLYGFTDDYIVGGNMTGIEYDLCLKDYDGKTVLETSLTPPNISDDEPLYTFPCGSDDEYLYLWSKVWSTTHNVQFIIRLSLKNGESEVIWSNDV